jgi:hypothetical protein
MSRLEREIEIERANLLAREGLLGMTNIEQYEAFRAGTEKAAKAWLEANREDVLAAIAGEIVDAAAPDPADRPAPPADSPAGRVLRSAERLIDLGERMLAGPGRVKPSEVRAVANQLAMAAFEMGEEPPA